MPSEQEQLEAGIQALEAQRALLGDAVVDVMLAPVRARLAVLLGSAAAAPSDQALRQVSILFLDVVGSTTLAQRLDPEAISDVMDDALTRGTLIVQAHRGKVLQYAGDNILAGFGVESHAEDDAERATLCGLALLELGRALGNEVLAAHGHAGFNVRVGIHTGGVLLGGGVEAAGTIRGIAVNIAARMEQTAPAGALRISQDTHDQVRGLFEVEAQAPLSVKGVDTPLQSYLVLRAKPRPLRSRSHGIEGVATKMVGRDTELAALQAACLRLFQDRQLAGVTVVAEAGIGKSRLLDEFLAWTEEHPQQALWFRGRATPQTQGQPFGLLRDIVAWRLQLSDDDTLAQAQAKTEQGLMPLFADEPEFAQGHAHLLGHLIGLSWHDSPHLRGILDDPRQIRTRGQYSAAQMFRRAGAASGLPVILQLEDLHWADDDSLDFLNYLAEVNRDTPLLMLASTRPTLFERRGDWRSTPMRHERIDLRPLDETGSRGLAIELLRKLPEVPAALQELIVGRADGNPFFMEELVRMLIDQGAIDVSGAHWRLQAERLQATRVPPTLTGVLQARLDGLPAAERLTLQEASVIGQVFWDLALLALNAQTATTLPRLVQRELARPRHDGEADGLREFSFQHALLHRVTYATVLKRQRQGLHGRLAHWLSAQSQSHSARAGDFLGLTAQHYEEAGEDANAAEFHARAAAHAGGRMAHAAALDHVQRALALLDRAGDSPAQAALRWRLLSLREQTREIQGERQLQEADLDALDQVALTMGDPTRQSYAAYRRAYRAYRMAAWPDCLQAAQQAVALADAALASLATQPAGAAQAAIEPQALHEQRLISLRLVGVALMNQSRWEPARALLQQTLDEARARGLVKPQAYSLNSLAMLAARQDDPVRSLALHRECLALWRQTGDRRAEAIAVYNIGAAWMGLGELAAAQEGLEEGLRLVRQNGDRASECAILCGLSELALWQGDDARAQTLARSAMDSAVAVQARELEASAWIRLGDAEAALGHGPQAAQAYAQAQQVEREIGNALRFGTNASLARLALMQGDPAGALRAVDLLLVQARSGTQAAAPDRADARADAWGRAATADIDFDGAEWPRLIELTVHRVCAAAGDPNATAWLKRAHDALQIQAQVITDAALRQMFLSNIPQHREILALWAARSQA